MKYLLLLLLVMGCAKPKKNYDLEVTTAVLEWVEHTRSHTTPLEHLESVKEAHRVYTNKPNRTTAAEVVTLIRMFMEKPVP